jgi:hypothetical protein
MKSLSTIGRLGSLGVDQPSSMPLTISPSMSPHISQIGTRGASNSDVDRAARYLSR